MDAERLRLQVQRLVRGLGLLGSDVTAGQRVTVAEAHVLQLLLERQDQSTNQRQLAALLGVDKSSVSRLVQRLVTARRVTRWVHPEDNRAREVALTPRGLGLARALRTSGRGRFAALVARIAVRDRAPMMAALQKLADALEPAADADVARPSAGDGSRRGSRGRPVRRPRRRR